MKITGAVAVVTGASRGIGRATAQALHAKGAKVGLIARNSAELDELQRRLGQAAAAAPADVTDDAAVTAAVKQLEAILGPIDILVNNAGIGAYKSVLEEDSETFERLMQVNYLGTVYPTRAVLPSMANRRSGHIVNVASIAGRVGAPMEAAYSASKFAVVGFSEALASEMSAFGINVSLVNPGPVETHFTEARGVPFQRDVPRPVSVERVAKAVVRAIEHNHFEQIIPRWLNVGPSLRAVAPGVYRTGMLKSTTKESSALASRWVTGS